MSQACGGSFSGGSGTFTVLRESRQEATFTNFRPFLYRSRLYRFTQTHHFFHRRAACACEKGGWGGRKNRRNHRTGRAYDRTSKRRVLLNARPRKSTRKGNQEYSFDHAVKSFNMVDAFGLLSSVVLAVHDFVTEDGSFACHERCVCV